MRYFFTLILINCVSVIYGQNGMAVNLKSFPSAYGAGSNTHGGRGGNLIIINTDDKDAHLTHVAATNTTGEHYTGGLYAALQYEHPAYIIFDRSMTITLGIGGTPSDFNLSAGIRDVNNKTIFGQSAPEGGVTITGGTFRFYNSDNLIFRYLKSRPILNKIGVLSTADDFYTWALLFSGGRNLIIDHCSFSFAQDKALGAFITNSSGSSAGKYTFSNNLVADSHTGYYFEINPDRPDNPEMHIDSISIIKNVATSVNRTPNMAYSGKGEIINNIAHDTPEKNVSVYHNLKLNHIGNYYSQQKTDSWNRIRSDIEELSGNNPIVYSNSNYYDGVLTGDANENNASIWKEGYTNGVPPAAAQYFTDSIHNHEFPNPYTPINAKEAFEELITNKNVGAAHYLNDNGNVAFYLDSFDSAQLAYVANDDPSYEEKLPSNWVLPNMPSNVRPATYDTDKDGMSDAWENRVFNGLQESYNGDFDGDGYTNIEEYYNQVDYINDELCLDDIVINNITINSLKKYNATNTIEINNSTFESNSTVIGKAGNSIVMLPNTHYKPGSDISLKIEACSTNGLNRINNNLLSEYQFERPANKLGVLIYPNPSDDYLNIKIDENFLGGKLTLCNMSNQIIWEKDRVNKKHEIVDVKQLSSGLYFLKATMQNKTTIIKVLKK